MYVCVYIYIYIYIYIYTHTHIHICCLSRGARTRAARGSSRGPQERASSQDLGGPIIIIITIITIITTSITITTTIAIAITITIIIIIIIIALLINLGGTTSLTLHEVPDIIFVWRLQGRPRGAHAEVGR